MDPKTKVPNVKVKIEGSQQSLSDLDRLALSYLYMAAYRIDGIYKKQVQKPAFYPADLTIEKLDQYLSEHPEKQEELLSPFTMVEQPDLNQPTLIGLPYHEIYKSDLQFVSQCLSRASILTTDENLKRFLALRSRDLLTSNYEESDALWVNLIDSPIEITIGPYESYMDKIKGAKRSFGALLGINLPNENRRVSQYREQVVDFDRMLADKYYKYQPSSENNNMIVIDEVYASGDYAGNYVAMAYNLPNDPDFIRRVGSKNVFIRNVMKAKWENLSLPIADIIFAPHLRQKLSYDQLLIGIIGHELSHGLGFKFTDEFFGRYANDLEETKADVFGARFLYFLVERGLLDQSQADLAVIAHLLQSIRQIRFDPDEAHAVGANIQLSFLWDNVGLAVRESDGKLKFFPKTFPEIFEALGDNLLEVWANRAEKDRGLEFIKDTAKPMPWLGPLLEKLEDIPVEIEPCFTFPRK